MELILQAAKDLTLADGGTIYSRTKDDRLRFEILRTDSLGLCLGGPSGQPIDYPRLPLYDTDGAPNRRMVAAHAAVSGRTVNVADAYAAREFDFSGTREFDARTGYRSKSFLTVPMKNHEDAVIGVLQFPRHRPISEPVADDGRDGPGRGASPSSGGPVHGTTPPGLRSPSAQLAFGQSSYIPPSAGQGQMADHPGGPAFSAAPTPFDDGGLSDDTAPQDAQPPDAQPWSEPPPFDDAPPGLSPFDRPQGQPPPGRRPGVPVHCRDRPSQRDRPKLPPRCRRRARAGRHPPPAAANPHRRTRTDPEGVGAESP